MSYDAEYSGVYTIELDDDTFELKVWYSGRVITQTYDSPSDFICNDDYVFTLDDEEVTERELVRRFGEIAEKWTEKAIENSEEL